MCSIQCCPPIGSSSQSFQGSENPRVSVYQSPKGIYNPFGILARAIGRIIEAVRNFFSWLSQKLGQCCGRTHVKHTNSSQAKEEKPLETKSSYLEELLAPYKALPSTIPEFRQEAYKLAKKHLTAKEHENGGCFPDPVMLARQFIRSARILILATVFSENAPVLFRVLYSDLRTEFAQLPESDKIAILQHTFDSEIKAGKIDKTPDGYHLIQNIPHKKNCEIAIGSKFTLSTSLLLCAKWLRSKRSGQLQEKVNISKQAGEWWKKCDVAARDAFNDKNNPILHGFHF